MNSQRLLPVVAACALLFASCSDDPFSPGSGSHLPREYHATLQSLDARFGSVCGTGVHEIYAMGDLVLRYDGERWNPIPPPIPPQNYGMSLSTAIGMPDGTVIAGNGGDIFVLEDDSWSTLQRSPGGYNDLWGTAADDLYALHWEGLSHFDGSSWTNIPVAKPDELRVIEGDENGQPIMVGGHGRIDRFDGAQWTTTYVDSMLWWNAVAVTASGRTFTATDFAIHEVVNNTAGLILDDEMYSPTLATDGDVLYALGYIGSGGFGIAKYENDTWSAVDELGAYARDMWVGQGEIAVVGDNLIWRGTASGGERVEMPPSRGRTFDAVAIGEAIYTIGDDAYRYLDGEWTDLGKDYITRMPAYAIDGRRPDDIYVVGSEMILHYDGRSWEWVNGALGETLEAVWVEPDGHVVAVGYGPVIVEFDGTTWTKKEVPLDGSFVDVTGVGDVVFAVGGGGLIGVRKENHWYLTRPTGWSFNAVWAYDEKHVYAVGNEDNVIWSYDGYRWSPATIEGPNLSSMTGIWGTSPNNLFVLDYNGTLAHYDGGGWREEERIFGSGMRTVTGTMHEVLTAGDSGSILYRK